MSSHGEEPRQRGVPSKLSTLHDKIAQFYYSHGLFCSTYPSFVICVAIFIVTLCCYPLRYGALLGYQPLQILSSVPNTSSGNFVGNKPYCYIQQVVLRVAVLPWEPNLKLGDAFRAPLYQSFKLLDLIRNHEDTERSKTLTNVCLHVEATAGKTKDRVFPQYSCLVLSPANMWEQDVLHFAEDKSLLSTVFNYQNLQKGKTSVAEMLFGMKLKDTGIKRYPLRTRLRILQYAVTLFYESYDEQFVEGLKQKLQKAYPLHQNLQTNKTDDKNEIQNSTVVIYYPIDINYYEFMPLIVSYIALFLYYYFSVRKIEFIKSKIGMAFTALTTVVCSLSMTLGLCFFFGLTLSLQGKEIFPYLVVLVGLENVLVLTKSVLLTPSHLDAKIRIAQGLSKEGWSITKNLLIEITILTIGLFTFVPAIQEFCIFAIVGLLSDFFLQMLFFSTILGIDIRRMENQVEKTSKFTNSLYQNYMYYNKSSSVSTLGMNRSKSHPRLSSFHTNIVATQTQVQDKRLPKRLRLVNVWARTRFFQRAFMILMVVWISMIVYKSGIIRNYFLNSTTSGRGSTEQSKVHVEFNHSSVNHLASSSANENYLQMKYITQNQPYNYSQTYVEELNKLKHPSYVPSMRLPLQHWREILKVYNVSLNGQSVAVLPSIQVSHVIPPEEAVMLRNPEEKYNDNFPWKALAVALDPIDFSHLRSKHTTDEFSKTERPLFPTSPIEIFFTTILCAISIVVLTYAVIVLYRCICSRNYAEWRTSWSSTKGEENSEVPVLLEVVPAVLEGHKQDIECIATDGVSFASCCVSGQLKVWDCTSGELLATIDRKTHFSSIKNQRNSSAEFDETISDSESDSSGSEDKEVHQFLKVRNRINTNFSNVKWDLPRTPNDFVKQYERMYLMQKPKNSPGGCECTTRIKCRHGGSANKLNIKDFVNSGSKVCSERSNNGAEDENVQLSPIWCMDYLENLIVVGCANGRIEFWEGTLGKLKCIFDDKGGVGITSIKIVGSRVIAAHINGALDFLQLQTYSQGKPIDWNFTCAYRRTHVRTASAGSITDHRDFSQSGCEENLQCTKVLSTRAHQQLITCLESDGGRVLTGSQDHTLRVFRLEDGTLLYTLHGHCGPVTCLFIDNVCPATSGSGSQDGMLCVWDLLTGACVYSVQAHDGSISSMTYSASYVISLGSDERLCIWERFQGHLLNTIYLSNTFSNKIAMLTPHLIVTVRNGALVIWDVRSGENVRSIVLGLSPFVFVKHLIMLRDAVLCDYGNQLRIVRFPLIYNKYD